MKILKILAGLLSLPLLGLGLKSMLLPESMLGKMAIEVNGSQGLNTVRGDVGGLLLGIGLLLAIGL